MCRSDTSLNRNSKKLVQYCKGPLLFLFYINDIAKVCFHVNTCKLGIYICGMK